MSIVLINQYMATDTKDCKTVQDEFTDKGVKSVIVPSGLSVEWLPGIGGRTKHPGMGGYSTQIAVIKIYGDTEKSRAAAIKLQKDLKENEIEAIILPSDTNVEILPTL